MVAAVGGMLAIAAISAGLLATSSGVGEAHWPCVHLLLPGPPLLQELTLLLCARNWCNRRPGARGSQRRVQGAHSLRQGVCRGASPAASSRTQGMSATAPPILTVPHFIFVGRRCSRCSRRYGLDPFTSIWRQACRLASLYLRSALWALVTSWFCYLMLAVKHTRQHAQYLYSVLRRWMCAPQELHHEGTAPGAALPPSTSNVWTAPWAGTGLGGAARLPLPICSPTPSGLLKSCGMHK